MTITCKKCGIVDGFIEEKGAQAGLYCDKCGRWIKWLSRDEARLFKHNEIQMLNENRRAGYNHGYTIGYNKAIDDFKSRLEERILAGKMIDEKFAYIDNYDIDEVAEQLKAGGNIELSEHSKSQGD